MPKTRQKERRTIPPLREVREAQGLSVRETARRAGLDPTHLSKVERGQAKLSIESLARLAAVLGLSTLAGLLDQYVVERDP
jgi:transcriptional regulator with XRE-family HTH domain